MLWDCPIPECDLSLEIGSSKPWRHRLVLGHLYWQHELSAAEVGAHLGCTKWTVQKHMVISGVSRRSVAEANRLCKHLHPLSAAVRARIAASHRGQRRSPVQRRNISQARRAQEYGKRIIRHLREAGADVALAQQNPVEVGRKMMGLRE